MLNLTHEIFTILPSQLFLFTILNYALHSHKQTIVEKTELLELVLFSIAIERFTMAVNLINSIVTAPFSR